MEPVPPFVPAERLFYAGGSLRRVLGIIYIFFDPAALQVDSYAVGAGSNCCAGASGGAEGAGTIVPCSCPAQCFKRDWIEHSKGRTIALLVSTQSQLGGLGGKAKIHLLWAQA